uniref:Uncharacterized protein n=1 Tax=Oryza barthii TaxID=65489 RepID=A0A0D3FLH6_9ORYZ
MRKQILAVVFIVAVAVSQCATAEAAAAAGGMRPRRAAADWHVAAVRASPPANVTTNLGAGSSGCTHDPNNSGGSSCH